MVNVIVRKEETKSPIERPVWAGTASCSSSAGLIEFAPAGFRQGFYNVLKPDRYGPRKFSNFPKIFPFLKHFLLTLLE